MRSSPPFVLAALLVVALASLPACEATSPQTPLGFSGKLAMDGPDFGVHDNEMKDLEGQCFSSPEGTRKFRFCFHLGRFGKCDAPAQIDVRRDGSAEVLVPWSHRQIAKAECQVRVVPPEKVHVANVTALEGAMHLVCNGSTRTGEPDHIELDVGYRGCDHEWQIDPPHGDDPHDSVKGNATVGKSGDVTFPLP